MSVSLGISPDILSGHRDRFLKIFKGLQKFYEKTMSLQYFKNLIEIHHLPKVRRLYIKIQKP